MIEITQSENLKAFKTFLNTTHTLATDMFVSPLAAVQEFKFRFAQSDTVLVYVPGAVTTIRGRQDFANYIDQQIY